MRRVSAKKRRQIDAYKVLRAEVLQRDGGYCEARLECCTFQAVHAHHILRRGQGGQDTYSNLLAVCDACHDWIHANVEASYESGLLLRRWSA